MSLKTDYKDEILRDEEDRRYNLVDENGRVVYSNIRLDKAYTPQQEGDKFSAKDINDTNKAVNDLNKSYHTLNESYHTLNESYRNLNESYRNLDESYRKQYSLNEKFTGKYWIDGKKIFKKVINVNANNAPHGINSLSKVISLTAIYYKSNTYGRSNCSNDVTIQKQNIYLVGDASQFVSSSNPITVIVEYTKTTD